MHGKGLTKEIWFYGKNYKMNLYTQLESKAKIQPTFTAIEWENGSLSYFQFLKLAGNIGSALIGKFKLEKGDKVALVGFGTFSVSKRAARKGRNPQTGKEIDIPAKNVVKFKAGSELSAKV